MCEYDPACNAITSPVAKVLSENPRLQDSIGLAVCPVKHHRLAVAYNLPGHGGDVLCTPHMKVRAASWLRPEALESAPAILHWHPAISPLRDYGPDAVEYGRCTDGTWAYSPSDLLADIEDHRAGRTLPAGELVKARLENGQVGRLGRAWAEQAGLEIVGTVRRNPDLDRPYTLGSYVRMADAPD